MKQNNSEWAGKALCNAFPALVILFIPKQLNSLPENMPPGDVVTNLAKSRLETIR
jgi:hypothetical protein